MRYARRLTRSCHNVRLPRWVYISTFVLTGLSYTMCSDDNQSESKPVPIEVSFVDINYTAGISDFTLQARIVKSAGDIIEMGFLFSDSPGVTEDSEKLMSPALGMYFVVTKTGLLTNHTYYARPYVVVDEQNFFGDEIILKTQEPSVVSIRPINVGRGQRVTINGNFVTNDQEQISKLVVGGAVVNQILFFSRDSVVFLIPGNTELGENNVQFELNSFSLNVPAITVGKWGKLNDPIANPSFFMGNPNQSYGFSYQNKLYHFVAGYCYIYNTEMDLWVQNNTLAQTALNRAFYFQVGSAGYVGELSNVNKKFYEFNMATQLWAEKASFPGGGDPFTSAAFTANSIAGFFGLGLWPGSEYEYWSYLPSANEWIQLKSFPSEKVGFAFSFALNGYIFIGGGQNASGKSHDVFAYSISDNTWTKVAEFPGEFPQNSFVLKGKGYVVTTDEIWVYNFDSNSWSNYGDFLPGASNRQDIRVFVMGEYVVIGGGFELINNSLIPRKDFYTFYPE